MAHPEYQLVRHKEGKLHFEVMTKPGAVLKWRKGEIARENLDDVLFSDQLFKSAHKGDHHTHAEITAAFGADDPKVAIVKILEKGELQLTAAERREKVEKRRREVINYVHKYYIDPKSKTPHPVARIDAALDEAKVRIDPDVPGDRQAHDAIRKLVDVIPLKKSEICGTLRIPHAFLGSSQGAVHRYASVAREKYDSDGVAMEISVVPGDYDAMMADLAKVCKGEFTFDIDGQAPTQEQPQDGKKGKGKKGGRGKGKKK